MTNGIWKNVVVIAGASSSVGAPDHAQEVKP